MASTRCVDCNEIVNPNTIGVYREINGWARVRAGGGTNAVATRVETGRLMCAVCGERRKMHARHGISAQQTSLV